MKKFIFSSLIAVLMLGLCPNDVAAQTEDKIHDFIKLEHPPQYPGGLPNFYKFLGETIKYPEQAKKEKIEGNVFVSFTVEKDGSLSNLNVDRGLGSGTDEEALRAIALSDKWSPGIIDGKPVRVKYNIPIKFSLKPKKNN